MLKTFEIQHKKVKRDLKLLPQTFVSALPYATRSRSETNAYLTTETVPNHFMLINSSYANTYSSHRTDIVKWQRITYIFNFIHIFAQPQVSYNTWQKGNKYNS